MSTYSHLAGRSVERLAALSDGVFAVGMTLLVLELKAPAMEAIHSEGDLAHALLALAPRLLVYWMSFMTLGIFWVGQQAQMNEFQRGDRNLTWIHLAFLFGVTLMPFSTALMAEYVAYRTALLVYWANILALGVMLYASWRYAVRAELIDPGSVRDHNASVLRRIIVAQALYAAGAALCVVSTYASIAVIILIQLNFALAPRIPYLSRV